MCWFPVVGLLPSAGVSAKVSLSIIYLSFETVLQPVINNPERCNVVSTHLSILCSGRAYRACRLKLESPERTRHSSGSDCLPSRRTPHRPLHPPSRSVSEAASCIASVKALLVFCRRYFSWWKWHEKARSDSPKLIGCQVSRGHVTNIGRNTLQFDQSRLGPEHWTTFLSVCSKHQSDTLIEVFKHMMHLKSAGRAMSSTRPNRG